MPIDQPEKGVRSPYVLRFGLSVPGCIGIYKQPDPGGIPSPALQDGINIRIASGNIYSRGGQTKINSETAMEGCVLNMIDVDGNLGLFNTDTNELGSESSPTESSIYRFSQTSEGYSVLVSGNSNPEGVDIAVLDAAALVNGGPFNTAPRRALVPFRGKLHVFAPDPADVTQYTFYQISLPTDLDSDTGSTGRLVKKFAVTEVVSSWCYNNETTTNDNDQVVNSGEVIYLGTIDGKIYRWDDSTLTLEATLGGGTNRVIMFYYHGDIYAARTNYLARRNGGTWTTTYAMPGGVVSWSPTAATEFVNNAFICGVESGVGNKVFKFDGTTLTVDYSTGDSACDLAVCNGLLFFAFGDAGSPTLAVNTAGVWSTFDTITAEAGGQPGALLAVGTTLYWWVIGVDADAINRVELLSYPDVTDNTSRTYSYLGTLTTDAYPPYDMVALGI